MMNFDSFTEEEEVQRVLDHHGDLKEAVGAHLNFTETRLPASRRWMARPTARARAGSLHDRMS
ncbi:unnamed protein product [Effrenium voratum]|nr:unnamed protein product [Effrenium voratum]